MATVIAARLAGIRNRLQPPAACQIDSASLSRAAAKEAGIKRLPASLTEALYKLQGDPLLVEILAAEIVYCYVKVKTSNCTAFGQKSVKFELEQHLTKF